MENSIEEDIKRIAKLITTKFNNDYSIDNVDKEAIEELLKAYKELKEIEESHRKENGKLRERVKELEEWNEYYRKEMLSKEYIKLNYIPKSKVKEKIEELDKRIDFLNTELTKCYIEREKLGTETDIDNNETYIFYMEEEKNFREKQKEILQELLGEE